MPGQPSTDLIRFTTAPSSCSYLPHESAQLEYRVLLNLTADTFGGLLRRGWRRFGHYVFRPQYPVCRACRSLRIPTATFTPSRSQRKALRRNQSVSVEISAPAVTNRHIDLFNAYHRDMSRRRDWPDNRTSTQDYYESFIGGHFEFAREFRYWRDGRLVGVGLVDQVDDGLSSAYFYHDPAWRRFSPGTFSILCEIDYARRYDIPFVYLGYWIRDNDSMNYKARFRPCELLESYVDDATEPVWRAAVLPPHEQ